MQKIFLSILLGLTVISCSTSKKTSISTTDVPIEKYNSKKLKGYWELQMLFASASKWNKTPYLILDQKEQTFSGNSGCNTINGKFTTSGSFIAFDKNFTSTKMACADNSEKEFLSTLQKVNKYTAANDELELSQGEIVLMKFKRK